MRCPKCGLITFDHLVRCKRCGAPWGSEPDASAPVPAEATPEPDDSSAVALELFLDDEFDRLYERLKREEEKSSRIPWAGFFRRASALAIDLSVLAILSLILFYFTYVCFSVGLAANDRQIFPGSLGLFTDLLLVAWIALVSGYFVILHGMEGRTVGKWLFGIRVIGTQARPIGYGQALIRWFGTLVSGATVVGMLWIIWGREKRGWHDILARTWVVRDWA